MMLLQAAADEWKVPAGELRVANGVITHPASGRSTSYGKVAAAAAKLAPPDAKTIVLKDPRSWTVAGAPKKRLDTGDKLDGSKKYAIGRAPAGSVVGGDQGLPGVGRQAGELRRGQVSGRRGVRGVVRVDERCVAVVADTWWRAKTALDALPIVWDEGEGAAQNSATIAARLNEGLRPPTPTPPEARATRSRPSPRRRARSRRPTPRRFSRTRRWSR